MLQGLTHTFTSLVMSDILETVWQLVIYLYWIVNNYFFQKPKTKSYVSPFWGPWLHIDSGRHVQFAIQGVFLVQG